MVVLSNDEIKCISLFESLTGAIAEDCLLEPGRIVFIVKEGHMGRAIGKGGSVINKVRETFKKHVEVFENASTVEDFVKHLFPTVQLKELKILNRDGERIAQISVNAKDRGAVIGRNGERIKLARTLLERRYGTKLRLV